MGTQFTYADLCVDLFDHLTEANVAKQRDTSVHAVHDFYVELASLGLAVGNAEGDEHTVRERPATIPNVDALVMHAIALTVCATFIRC